MKTNRLWLHFIVHNRRASWYWKPVFLRSQTVYNLGGKMWIAPHFEFVWLFIVLQFTFFSRRKEYEGTYYEPECVSEILQDRINILESAIRKHKDQTTKTSQKDLDLWNSLN